MAATNEDSDVPVSKTPTQISLQEVAEKFSARSDLQGLLQLILHGSLLAFSGYLIHLGLERKLCWLQGAGTLLHAFFISFLFMPLHECVHQTAFASGWLNKLLGFFTGLATMRPPQHYKR